MTVVARCIKTMAFKLGGNMNEQRIREIANQCSDFAEQIPFFRGIENGLTWEATIQKARDLKFTELVIRECMTICDEIRADYFKHRKAADDFTDKNIYAEGEAASDIIKYKMKKHFGVEE